jgi:hypothetical protein
MSLQEFDITTIGNELDVRFPALQENQVLLLVKLLETGTTVSPIGVYVRDGRRFVYDGRHRLEACRRLGWKFIMGEEIEFTNKADMLCRALQSNVSPSGTPLSPSLQDYKQTIRSLVKEGVAREDIIQRLTAMGIHESFVKDIVKSAISSKQALNQYHAVQDVKEGRRTVDEAANFHKVAVEDLKERLATPKKYELMHFGTDVKKKFKSIRELATLRLPEFVNNSVEIVDGAPHPVGLDAVMLLKRETETFLKWIVAQEISLGHGGQQ